MQGYLEAKPLISIAYHKPVLLREVVEALGIKDGWYLDATIGEGGHSLEILSLSGKVVGVDQDPQALERSGKRFEEAKVEVNRYRFIQGNFRDLKNLIQQTDLKDQKFAAVLFDLGVSSLQLMGPERGFSFRQDAPLDMRMDPSLKVKASDLINGLTRKELNVLFSKLGEERNSWALADALVLARQVARIETTRQLVEVVERVVGSGGRIHPATRVFQALRIAVNDELSALQEGLPQALEVTESNGRILVISFHSLEDRIVKNFFRNWQDQGLGLVLTKKPIRPKVEEVLQNPRSRSAKMRVFEKI